MQFSSRLRIAANLVFAFAQVIAAGYIFGTADFEALAADGPNASARDLATPAVYAFAIWNLIYLGSIGYAIVQALPSQRERPIFGRIGWLTAVCFAACTVWIFAARFGPAWLTVPLIWIMFITIAFAFLRTLGTSTDSKAMRWIVTPALAIYTGWLTAAVILNATNVLPSYGVSLISFSPVSQAIVTLALASILALVVSIRSRGYLPYVFTILWAFAGVIASNWGADIGQMVIWAAVAGIITLLAVSIWARFRMSAQSVA